MARRGKLGAVVRYVLACVCILGTVLPFVVASPAPAAHGERGPAQVAFGKEAFKFQIIVQDDGKDSSGGWQKASAKLTLIKQEKKSGKICIPGGAWTCTVTVGMPVRHSSEGVISTDRAADMTALIASMAADNVLPRQTDWVTGDLCRQFRDEMESLFKKRDSNRQRPLGATVAP